MLALLIAVAFEAFLVVSNYSGNVTGLFYTGQETRLPPELAAEPTVRVEDKRGYDGQFYHVVAHDPLMRRGWQDFVDNPRLRWRRIGLPGSAALIAAASHSDLHYAYAGLQLVSLFVVSYWLA